MAFIFSDGLGTGRTAGISPGNRLMTAAETNLSGHFVSRDEGLAFNTVGVDSSSEADDHVFYFQNTSPTRDFFVDLMRFQAVNAALWKVFVATGTAAGGSELTPTSLNLSSGAVAEATARGSGAITGVTAGSLIAVARNAAAAAVDVPFDDVLILGTNDAFVVEYDTGTTGASEVLMRGYYKLRE